MLLTILFVACCRSELENYIVVLKKDASVDLHISQVNLFSGAQRIKHVYDASIIKGYAAKFDSDSVEHVRTLQEVAYVQRDGIKSIFDVQKNAPWGIARLSSSGKVRKKDSYY